VVGGAPEQAAVAVEPVDVVVGEVREVGDDQVEVERQARQRVARPNAVRTPST
jgi:hypothetical protein